MQTISEREFVDHWGARGKGLDGGELFAYADVVSDYPIQNVWTVVDAGDHLIALAGYHVVNCQGYVVTTIPWAATALQAYWYQADPPECGHSACAQNYIDTGESQCLEEDGE